MELLTLIGVILVMMGLFKMWDSDTTNDILVACIPTVLGIVILFTQYVLTGTIVGL